MVKLKKVIVLNLVHTLVGFIVIIDACILCPFSGVGYENAYALLLMLCDSSIAF